MPLSINGGWGKALENTSTFYNPFKWINYQEHVFNNFDVSIISTEIN